MSKPLTLNDVCSLIVDCEHKTAPEAVIGQEYGYSVGTPNVRRGRIILSSAKRVDESTFGAWSARAMLQKNDIIFTREAPAGEAGLVDGVFPVCLGQRTVMLRPDSRMVVPRYLHYRLLAPEIQKLIHSRSEGSTVAHLNVQDIRRMVLGEVPSIDIQDAIASILGALDDKIIVNDRIAGAQEKLLTARFDALAIDTDPISESAIETSQLVEFNPLLQVPRTMDAVYLDMAAVPTDRATVQEWVRREPKPGTRFSNGDTVMARITPCLENGKTAFIDFMSDGEVGIGSTEFIVMRARPGIPMQLPYFLARSPRFRNHAVQNMVGSSGRQRVGAGQLVSFPLAKPDPRKLSEFREVAHNAFRCMRIATDESRTLGELRDTLLPKLMAGEIRVRLAEKVVGDVT